MATERERLWARAQMRAQLCDDVQDACRSVRWPEHLSPEDAAFVADKLWEKGWRLAADAEEAVWRGMASLEEDV